MDLVFLVVTVLLLWQTQQRWHLLERLLRLFNKTTGVSLPLVILGYLWAILPMLLIHFRHQGPEYWHAGAAEFSALVFSAMVVLVVVPASVYDMVKRKWYGVLSIPLSMGLYFAMIGLFQLLYTSGRVVLIE